MKPYPIFLNNLDEQRSVVIGGDHEAERKVRGLLDVDANVTLIAPEVTRRLQDWADDGAIEWIARDYQPGDLEGAFLVIISETNPEKTHPIWEEAQERNVLINAMDDVPHCTFVAGSVVRRGPLVLSISTSGAAPALSVRLRQRWEKEFGPEYGEFLSLMQALREPLAERHPGFKERKRRWYELVDGDAFDHLRAGDRAATYRAIEAAMGEDVASVLIDHPAWEGDLENGGDGEWESGKG